MQLHYKISKLYFNLGLQLKIIRRILEFKQEPLLKPYFKEKQKKKITKSTKCYIKKQCYIW